MVDKVLGFLWRGWSKTTDSRVEQERANGCNNKTEIRFDFGCIRLFLKFQRIIIYDVTYRMYMHNESKNVESVEDIGW